LFFVSKIFYYFCIQEVEEETGSAEEQPVSNRLPALRSNMFYFGRETCIEIVFLPLLFVTDIALWLKKPNPKLSFPPFVTKINYKNNLL